MIMIMIILMPIKMIINIVDHQENPMGIAKKTHINGNFRILKWRYLPYIRPI